MILSYILDVLKSFCCSLHTQVMKANIEKISKRTFFDESTYRDVSDIREKVKVNSDEGKKRAVEDEKGGRAVRTNGKNRRGGGIGRCDGRLKGG